MLLWLVHCTVVIAVLNTLYCGLRCSVESCCLFHILPLNDTKIENRYRKQFTYISVLFSFNYLGELFLALVTSKRAHAKIVHIDASAALLIPGVLGFIDHRDIPGQNKWGALVPEEELLASEEVIGLLIRNI